VPCSIESNECLPSPIVSLRNLYIYSKHYGGFVYFEDESISYYNFLVAVGP
jgi:hypothetical protein